MKELSALEVRVLGVLVEKELTTPELYPLTLNALTNACNQKSNRLPVVSYDTATVKETVDSLSSKSLAITSDIPGSRVRKFRHFFTDRFKFVPAEAAILCELMLRGPQTLGELRAHAGRMHAFQSLEVVEKHIKELMDISPPWIVLLPRQPGRKEQRYMHTLMGVEKLTEIIAEIEAKTASGSGGAASLQARVVQLETEVVDLRRELTALQESVQSFKAQFE